MEGSPYPGAPPSAAATTSPPAAASHSARIAGDAASACAMQPTPQCMASCHPCRPIGPLFTLGFIVLGLIGPVLEVWVPVLRAGPNAAVIVLMLLSILSVLLLLWSFVMVAVVHPGPVGVSRRYRCGLSTEPAAVVLRPPSASGARTCPHCRDVKPSTAHHCRTCNVCVDMMDHHCPWIGQCVGRANHKHFALFLGYCALSGFLLAASVMPSASTLVSRGNSYEGIMPTFNILLFASLITDVAFALILLCFFFSVMSRAASGETKLDQMRRERNGRAAEGANASARTADRASESSASSVDNLRVYFGTGPVWLWWLPIPPQLEYDDDDDFAAPPPHIV